MADSPDTARIPLEPLRKRVADATGRSTSYVDIQEVAVDGTALEVTFSTPDGDVPVIEIVVEGPTGRIDTTPARLDSPFGLNVYGELLRVEYAGRDAETDEIMVSVSRRDGEEWRTVLGCGRMWAIETTYDGDPVTITCHAKTPSAPEDEADDAEEEEEPDTESESGGLLGGFGG
ncbi:hypothetical protein GCM10008995_03320 [Halobellus salinus]|uniref:Uncharacterized protein n=1 Tax=Halobellus salinus TaxID=931585 RepID=A0A830EBW3_9EURY|nr:hypothetical protein [Halobellus salinus]GGI96618.1 hypothetical protein GCM10008995_03320 [Halobellus salinus]SMP13342.1 hypothetical protein SAMN06265347_104182 [Halobellus salinus]